MSLTRAPHRQAVQLGALQCCPLVVRHRPEVVHRSTAVILASGGKAFLACAVGHEECGGGSAAINVDDPVPRASGTLRQQVVGGV